MKKLLCVWSLFSIAGLCGLNMPTSFECKGNDVHVMITSNGDESYSMMVEMGDETYMEKAMIPEETMIGELFSVVVMAAPDFMREDLVVLMPAINMIRMSTVEFQTGMMRVVTRNSFAGPVMVDGAIDQYMGSYQLTCVARGTPRIGG